MPTFKIEKKVPITNARGGRPSKYGDTIKALKVGDSFYVPNRKITSTVAQMSRWGLILGIQLTCRTEKNGVRVWRTK